MYDMMSVYVQMPCNKLDGRNGDVYRKAKGWGLWWKSREEESGKAIHYNENEKKSKNSGVKSKS